MSETSFFIPHSKPFIGQREKDLVLQVIEEQYVGIGSMVERANKQVCQLFQTNKSFLVNSGSSSIFLALKALSIQKGDEVIVSEYGCPSLLNQVINLGAVPVVVDTLPNSFFIDLEQALKAIRPQTKAILFYHPFGYYDPAIIALKDTGLPIIEDLTHSFLATYQMYKAGELGDIIVSSLGSSKFITAGTGGIITSNNESITKQIEILLDYDYLQFNYTDSPERFNFSLGDLNAALFLAQLEQLENMVERRQTIARYYQQHIQDAFKHPNFEGSAHYRFFLKPPVTDLNPLITTLRQKGIICYRGGIKLISEVYETNNNQAKTLHSKLLSIPIYPALKEEEVTYITNQINQLICS